MEGERISGQKIGGIGYDVGHDLAIDVNGNLSLVGIFNSLVDFETGTGLNYLTADNSQDFFITSFNSDCLDFFAQIAEVIPVNCNTDGSVIPAVTGGTLPYLYEWNNSSSSTDSIAFFENAGNYSLTITDDIGCQRITNFEIGGTDEDAFIDYDFTGNLHTTNFRTGFHANVWLDIFNRRCIPTDGQVQLTFDPLLTFENADIAPDENSNNQLTWSFNDLSFDSIHFTSMINFSVSTDAMIGDSVLLNLKIIPNADDANIDDNIKTYSFPIINGYDPNDKQVYPARCAENYILTGEVLTYTVRFQNTGNAEAINVRILDTLDNNLDLNTLKIVGNRHPLVTEVLDNNILNFRFDNILLPDSLSNEAESHGFVIYEIQSKEDLVEGTIIENSAAIYFDFNPPIITNTVSNEIINELPTCFLVSSNEELKQQSNIQVYPNPAKDLVYIESQNLGQTIQLRIFDSLGKLVKQEVNLQGDLHQIKITNLPSGIYFIQIEDGKKNRITKFTIQ